MKYALATVVTRILDPFLVLFVILALAFTKGGVTQVSTWVLAIILMVGVPVLLLVVALQRRIISDWDMRNRRERPRVMVTLLIVEMISLWIIRPLVSPWVTGVFIQIFFMLIGFTLITLRWKISGHAFASALLGGYVVAWYGFQWWPVLFIAPVVGWSRVVRKNHTPLQTIAGAFYPWTVIALLTLV